jgi:hypothetical protein
MKAKGTYSINYDTYYVVVEYEYYWDNGTHEQPPEEDLTILKVLIDSNDITDFCFEYVKTDELIEDVKQYAIENKYENLN